ncbi:MAG TPA: hypothetical protein VMI94_02255 [Bryobacteraceae bacterium]|nr:hypothetical protein [Bryobacteraceae bacterium]
MRHVICALGTLLCGMLPALPGADLTVVLNIESDHSPRSVALMEGEAGRLLQESGIVADWRTFDQISPGQAFTNIAVVTLKGRCEMTPLIPGAIAPAGRLGVTYRVDGRVIPFSEVECDEVRSTLATARLPVDPAAREALYGRALGRVLAHELFHVIHRNGRHTRDGVGQKYFSATTLLDDHID